MSRFKGRKRLAGGTLMKVIGITGGVGAGKSSVLALLKEVLIPATLYRQTLLQEIYTTQVILDLKRSLIYSENRRRRWRDKQTSSRRYYI